MSRFLPLSFLFSFALATSVAQDLPALIPYRVGDQMGYCDAKKRIVIQPIYDYVEPFDETYKVAKVQLQNKVGLIDTKGNVLVPIQYAYCPDGGWMYCFEDEVGDFDPKEKKFVPCKYQFKSETINGYSIVRKRDKQGLVDKDDNIVLPVIYSSVEEPRGKYVIVSQKVPPIGEQPEPGEEQNYNSKFGMVDLSNKNVIIPFLYNSLYGADSGYLAIGSIDNTWDLINREGKVVASGYQSISPDDTKEGLFKVEQNHLFGFIDIKGRQVIPPL